MEHLVLGCSTAVYSVGAVIRETYGNGFVGKVDALDEKGVLHTVWEGTDNSRPGAPENLWLRWPRTEYRVTGLKIWVDTAHNLDTWEEIDAVRLLGGPEPAAPEERSH